MSESRWVPVSRNSPWYEKKPYDECPNCGKYKYREMKIQKGHILRLAIPWVGNPYFEYQNSCKNCGYETESWSEE